MAPIEEIFCEIDDFCKAFFPQFERGLLPAPGTRRRRVLAMSASEIMTIVILFHLSQELPYLSQRLINRLMSIAILESMS